MKIFDCFSYWDEDLLVDLRLNILNQYVDFFVIVEGNKTWQNNPKELRFNIENFEKFKDKIIYVPVNDMPRWRKSMDKRKFSEKLYYKRIIQLQFRRFNYNFRC